MKRFVNLVGTVAAFMMSLTYLADGLSVDTVDGLLLTTAFVVLLVYPVVNAVKWFWHRDVLPWIRRKTKTKGGETPKKR